MKKENVRILFNNRKGKITEIQVIEFDKDKEGIWPMHLYKFYDSDIGNCTHDWNEWTLSDILLKFFYQYGFVDKISEHNFIDELYKIEEFRKDLSFYRREED